MGNLQTPIGVQRLRSALHAKAKEEPEFRFYLLYDKVYRRDVLEHAYRSCKANKGAAGVDGVRFEDIEASGEEQWLGELAERLKRKDYRAEAVKRVWIPKSNGKLRPLGIPTITDRVVQTALLIVLEPIFEADLQPEQYAYRAERGAQDAVRAVHGLLATGHRHVIDADLSGYFDSIPHFDLMKSVARRIVDRHVLHLIKQWLEAPVEECDERGHRKRSTSNRDAGRGTPQGAPISPLLSNLYMRRFILGWKQQGHERRWSAHIAMRMLERLADRVLAQQVADEWSVHRESGRLRSPMSYLSSLIALAIKGQFVASHALNRARSRNNAAALEAARRRPPQGMNQAGAAPPQSSTERSRPSAAVMASLTEMRRKMGCVTTR